MFINFLFVFILVASFSTAAKKYSADSNCRSRRDYECDDGSCVDEIRICDGKKDCSDGGDELSCTIRTEVPSILQSKCELPPYPANGQYTVIVNSMHSGNSFVVIIINCDKGYEADGSSSLHCFNGLWSKEIPNCVSQCQLMPQDSVEYHCQASGSTNASRACNEFEPRGTVVTPKCRSPNYYSPTVLDDMHCVEGNWNYTARCILVSCELKPHDSVQYHCLTAESTSRECNEVEPVGTVVTPTCRSPDYFTTAPLENMQCIGGNWNHIARCKIAQCKLKHDDSVEYRCLSSGSTESSRVCKEDEPTGTVATPICKGPFYYTSTPLPHMRCIHGSWDYVAKCTPECGRVVATSRSVSSIGGKTAHPWEVPWHAGIYTKKTLPYQQICGGTIISDKIVLTSAHCFWRDDIGKLPATDYAVGVGSIYRPWSHHAREQKSDVEEIHLADRFQGGKAYYQNNIAVVKVETAFEYGPYVRPVCINFDVNFEKQQLQPGKQGKFAGWDITEANGYQPQVLKVIDLPYVDIRTCIAESPPSFREYITSDVFCAGFKNESEALCRDDSGGGLTFSELERGVERYYLRGISSTAPVNDNLCNEDEYSTFTQIQKHEHFIKRFWSVG